MRSTAFFFFNDTATTEIYTLSLHDALPISFTPAPVSPTRRWASPARKACWSGRSAKGRGTVRSEEHTSELQSQSHLVCRLLLERQNLPRCDRPLAPSRTARSYLSPLRYFSS